jgi:putrescine oxidase
MEPRYDVLVIGAGLAGLSAAANVVRQGLSCLVLEARDRVGGRVHNVALGDDAPNELGGQWVAPYHTAVHELAAELGVALFPAHRTGDSIYVDAIGTAHRYDGHDLPLPPESLRAYEVAVAALDAIVAQLDPERPWLHARAEELDAQSFEHWLDQHVKDKVARDLLRVMMVRARFHTLGTCAFADRVCCTMPMSPRVWTCHRPTVS